MTPSSKLNTMALASIAVAILVMGIKYVAYLRTGSVALYSDALESIVNVLTAVIAVVAINISARPADTHHQYGHHKVQYFSAVLEGALIITAALVIINEAVGAAMRPRQLEQPLEGMLINGVATAINAGWAFALISRGQVWRSPALVADGWHLVSDVATSLGVIVGLGLAATTGLAIIDAVVAGLVALHILWIGWGLIQASASSLMDRAVDPQVGARIERIIAGAAAGALQAHDIRTRTAGPATFIEFHLVVPGSMTVDEAHAICDRLEDEIERDIEGASVLIHVEPDHKAKPSAAVTL